MNAATQLDGQRIAREGVERQQAVEVLKRRAKRRRAQQVVLWFGCAIGGAVLGRSGLQEHLADYAWPLAWVVVLVLAYLAIECSQLRRERDALIILIDGDDRLGIRNPE